MASELERMLAERGLTIRAGKMSGLRSGSPAGGKLDELKLRAAADKRGLVIEIE